MLDDVELIRAGLAVPMPTLPLAAMSMELVGAPGRMRNGRREPPVTSRTKKFASLPAMSQVWAVKPPALFCSRRMAGVLLVVMWRSRTGVEVRRPTRPVLSTKIEFVGAAAVTVKGTVAAVMSSIENLFAPPLAESFAVSCQSWFGKPVDVLVSSNLMRVLFSLSRIVSKPKISLLTQSRPTQRLPWMISVVRGDDVECFDRWSWPRCVLAVPRAIDAFFGRLSERTGSVASDETNEPFSNVKAPDWRRHLVQSGGIADAVEAASSPLLARLPRCCVRTPAETRGVRRIS